MKTKKKKIAQAKKTNTYRRSSSQLRRKKRQKSKKYHRFLLDILLFFSLLILALYIQSFFFFSFVKVNSYDMSPTLRFGKYVLVEKKRRFQRQDIVLIHRTNSPKIEFKRIVGLPKETIDYHDDQLYINGTNRGEPFIASEKKEAKENGFSYTKEFRLSDIINAAVIPEDHYFVLGDNRLYSTDSRDYGVIKKEEILAVVTTGFN